MTCEKSIGISCGIYLTLNRGRGFITQPLRGLCRESSRFEMLPFLLTGSNKSNMFHWSNSVRLKEARSNLRAWYSTLSYVHMNMNVCTAFVRIITGLTDPAVVSAGEPIFFCLFRGLLHAMSWRCRCLWKRGHRTPHFLCKVNSVGQRHRFASLSSQ